MTIIRASSVMEKRVRGKGSIMRDPRGKEEAFWSHKHPEGRLHGRVCLSTAVQHGQSEEAQVLQAARTCRNWHGRAYCAQPCRLA